MHGVKSFAMAVVKGYFYQSGSIKYRGRRLWIEIADAEREDLF